MNAESSRSHQIFCVVIESTDLQTQTVTRGKLSFVDLAGSERVKKSGATGEQLKEAMAINMSLSALGNVINALATEQAHVPYRDHRLTMLMSDSLGGSAKTLMFCNVSPSVRPLRLQAGALSTLRPRRATGGQPRRDAEQLVIRCVRVGCLVGAARAAARRRVLTHAVALRRATPQRLECAPSRTTRTRTSPRARCVLPAARMPRSAWRLRSAGSSVTAAVTVRSWCACSSRLRTGAPRPGSRAWRSWKTSGRRARLRRKHSAHAAARCRPEPGPSRLCRVRLQ